MNEINTVFADTSFLTALIHTKDTFHQKAIALFADLRRKKVQIVTTHFILLEIGDGMAKLKFRQSVMSLINFINSDPAFVIEPATPELFDKAWKIYRDRNDKEWGLTDCASFGVMREKNILAALSSDRHFQQAGFRALLLEM